MKISVILVALLMPLVSVAATQTETSDEIAKLVPEGFKLVKVIQADLNKDGADDIVLVVQDTNPANFEEFDGFGIRDMNRQGVVIAFNREGVFDTVLQNTRCFESGREPSIYFRPELEVYSKRGNLYISFQHGRYGNWTYNFRYQNQAFELIGYDSVELNGPVVSQFKSINFSTQKVLTKQNHNTDPDAEDDLFVESWQRFSLPERPRLSDINDFHSLRMDSFLNDLQPLASP